MRENFGECRVGHLQQSSFCEISIGIVYECSFKIPRERGLAALINGPELNNHEIGSKATV